MPMKVDRQTVSQLVVHLARSWVERMRYTFREEDACLPTSVNCYLFTHFVFTQLGLVLPRSLGEQSRSGKGIGRREDWRAADLIFTKGRQGQEYADGVGHVGIFGGQSVIHASARMGNVGEESVSIFTAAYEVVRVRRVIGL